MAALRAKIIQRMTSINLVNSNSQSNDGKKILLCQPAMTELCSNIPIKNPIRAKGIAKIV
jgi:hypothetical protein